MKRNIKFVVLCLSGVALGIMIIFGIEVARYLNGNAHSPNSDSIKAKQLSELQKNGDQTTAILYYDQNGEELKEDEVIIPDRFNTGITCAENELTPAEKIEKDYYFFSKYAKKGSKFDKDKDGVIENIVFDSLYFNKPYEKITFRNCVFRSTGTYCVQGAISEDFDALEDYLTFENCDFSGATSATVVGCYGATFKNCYFHDMSSDCFKSDVVVENCYITSLGASCDAHADGIQTTSGDFAVLKNVRFELPAFTDHVSNAALFFQYEPVDGNQLQLQVENVIANGGNYTCYIQNKKEDANGSIAGSVSYRYGCAYLYGSYTSNGYGTDQVKMYNEAIDSLYVGSVWADDEKIYISVSNDTNTERTLQVITDTQEVYEFVIPACPTGNEIMECLGRQRLEFEDFPFDIVCEIASASIKWIVCEEQGRRIRTHIL